MDITLELNWQQVDTLIGYLGEILDTDPNSDIEYIYNQLIEASK